jgi:phospholipid/cholesterol/gamma-HCH transport system substrate-binding protein
MEKGMKPILAKFIVFALVSLTILGILWNTMTNKVNGSSRHYSATFTNVSGLRVGDDVRIAGVRVGRVSGLKVKDTLADVKFEIEKAQTIYTNTLAVVRYQNLLGQRYVALLPGSGDAQPLKSGSSIPLESTTPGFDLTTLLNGLEPLFSTLNPADVNRFASNIIQVMQGEGGTVDSLLQQVSTFTNGLADKDQVIGDIVTNLTPVLQNLNAHGAQFDATVAQLKSLMTGLAKDRTTIGNALDSVTSLAQATSSLTQQIRPSLEADVTALRKFADVNVRHKQAGIDLLQALPTALGSLDKLGEYGSWLNIYLCNMTVSLGTASVNTATVLNGYSQVCR